MNPCELGYVLLGVFVLMACVVVAVAYYEGYHDGLDDKEGDTSVNDCWITPSIFLSEYAKQTIGLDGLIRCKHILGFIGYSLFWLPMDLWFMIQFCFIRRKNP